MKVLIGSDNNAFTLKEEMKRFIQAKGIEVADYGCYTEDEVDYPDVAFQLADDIRRGVAERGILLCGTGIGMAIAAGKVPGIRAALCHDTYSAQRARKSNNAQILTLGAKVVGMETAREVVEAWLNSDFSGGGSARKVNKIMEQEQHYLSSYVQDDHNSNFGCS